MYVLANDWHQLLAGWRTDDVEADVDIDDANNWTATGQVT
jgi:hypothetical protein